MPEIPGHIYEALEAENTQLRQENERLKRENAGLKNQLAAMQEQTASMAALFKGARPTEEGRRAHAELTLRKLDPER